MSARHVTPLAAVNVDDIVAWISSIPFTAWPQQHRLNGELRPAMVNRVDWRGFGAATDALVAVLMTAYFHSARSYQRMLSVVMPGHSIGTHTDVQIPDWVTRVHVPLVTNERAWFTAGGVDHHLTVGTAYTIDTLVEHSVRNEGSTPRIHFMFDVCTTA